MKTEAKSNSMFFTENTIARGELLEPVCLQLGYDNTLNRYLESHSTSRLTWKDYTDAEKYLKYLCHLAGPASCYQMKKECEQILKGCGGDVEQPMWPLVLSVVCILVLIVCTIFVSLIGFPVPIMLMGILFCAVLVIGIIAWNVINYHERMEKNRKVRLYCEFKIQCIHSVAEDGFDKPMSVKIPVSNPNTSQIYARKRKTNPAIVLVCVFGVIMLLLAGVYIAYLFVPFVTDILRPIFEQLNLNFLL